MSDRDKVFISYSQKDTKWLDAIKEQLSVLEAEGAMDKRTLYLVENDMNVLPADVNGLINDRFDWNNPEPDVERAVFVELTGAPPPVAAVVK